MEFPLQIDIIGMGLPIVHFKGSQAVLNYDVFLSLKAVFILANSADPDEMQHHATFHLGLRCFQKYQFRQLNLGVSSMYIQRVNIGFDQYFFSVKL